MARGQNQTEPGGRWPGFRRAAVRRSTAAGCPPAAGTAGDAEREFRTACARRSPGPTVLRDYVKSVKHYWHEAACIPDVADHAAAWKVRPGSVNCAGTSSPAVSCCAGSRSPRPRKGALGGQGGTCRLATAHPDKPGDLPRGNDLAAITPLIRSLGLPFVAADLALRADGTWRVGDGQVSDHPASTEPAAFLNAVLTLACPPPRSATRSRCGSSRTPPWKTSASRSPDGCSGRSRSARPPRCFG